MQVRRKYWLSLVSLLLLSALAVSCTSKPKTTLQVRGVSMEPNLHEGQPVQVEEVSLSDLKRGDIIAFEMDGATWVKRLIGLPGDTIEMRNGKVLLNDIPLDEPYAVTSPTSQFARTTVRANGYFVLGDDREKSRDSRSYGPVPVSNIIGRVVP